MKKSNKNNYLIMNYYYKKPVKKISKWYWIASVFLILAGLCTIYASSIETLNNKLLRQHVTYNFGPAQKYYPIIVREAYKNNIEPELIAAVIIKESCYTYVPVVTYNERTKTNETIWECNGVYERIVGGVGEIGLMQIRASTCLGYASVTGCSNLFNPDINIKIGTIILKDYINIKKNMSYGVSAYNTGPNTNFYSRKYVEDVTKLYLKFKGQRKISLIIL